MKGYNLAVALSTGAPVLVIKETERMEAGIAATHPQWEM
jgi:hypothetical protein